MIKLSKEIELRQRGWVAGYEAAREAAAQLAGPWPGFAGIKESKTDKIVNSLRREIAEKIRALKP